MAGDLPGGGRRARHQRRVEGDASKSADLERTRILSAGGLLERARYALTRSWHDGRLRSGLIAAVAGLAILAAIVVFVLPLPEAVIPSETRILDIHGEIAGRLFTQNRVEIPLDKMAKDLPNAVVTIEDARFYRHRGVDIIGIARALVRDIMARKIVEGGSTITQQLAKQLYTTGKRTLPRKIYDASLAIKLEARYTKPEILAMYINTAYMGEGTYGAEAAAHRYFGKTAAELTLAESAMLAGLIRSPEYYSPYRSIQTATDRRNLVLAKMVEQGYISQAQYEQASKEPITLAGKKPIAGEAPYFTAYIIDQIKDRHPEIVNDLYTGGYIIQTTLDLKMQRAANTAFANGFTGSTKDANGVPQPEGALVAIDPTNGHIRAMVGGRDYSLTQLNRAYQSVRQPGSAFKPFLYSAVIDSGFTAASTQVCEYVSYPSGRAGGEPYEPADYGDTRYHNAPMTIRRGIQISDNVTAIKWASQIGPKAIATYAKKMGIKSPLEESLPLALGASVVSPLEMATAYCTLANGGLAVQPLSILKISDKYGNVIEENRPSVSRTLDERTAYIVTYMMTGVFEPGGTGSRLASTINRTAAGKTGTTNSQRDAWFMGFTPDLVCAVYVGHDDPATPLAGFGGTLAGPIWANFMAGALADVPAKNFPEPAGLEHATVCLVTGQIANATCPAHDDAFVPGTAPTGYCWVTHDPENKYSLPQTQPPAPDNPWGLPPWFPFRTGETPP
ncbi:MAG: transglycosylase domain-containing protein [Chloroflexota bacterium]